MCPPYRTTDWVVHLENISAENFPDTLRRIEKFLISRDFETEYLSHRLSINFCLALKIEERTIIFIIIIYYIDFEAFFQKRNF